MISPGRYSFHFLVSVTITAVLATTGCDFEGAPVISKESMHRSMQSVSIGTPYTSNRFTFHEDAHLKVVHGASCSKARAAKTTNNAGNTSYGVGVHERIAIPIGYDSATVYLNGWRLKYRDGDHEVLGLSTAIVDIEKQARELRWKAGGIISDGNGDDPFAWCYHYTVLMWKSHALDLDASANDSDINAALTFFTRSERQTYNTERNILSGFNDIPKALIPRGFGMLRLRDHHLGTFALKYGDPSIIRSEDGINHGLSWEFLSVFADKSFDDFFFAAQVVSTMHGDSVKLQQQPFTVNVNQPHGAPGNGIMDIISETVVVDNVPFDYAVPMLSGWYIGGNSNSDSHIKDIGVWIESFNYSKTADRDVGTLTYTIKSVFRDKGSHGAGRPDYQVSILGLNPKGIVLSNPVPGPGTIHEPVNP